MFYQSSNYRIETKRNNKKEEDIYRKREQNQKNKKQNVW